MLSNSDLNNCSYDNINCRQCWMYCFCDNNSLSNQVTHFYITDCTLYKHTQTTCNVIHTKMQLINVSGRLQVCCLFSQSGDSLSLWCLKSEHHLTVPLLVRCRGVTTAHQWRQQTLTNRINCYLPWDVNMSLRQWPELIFEFLLELRAYM